ncbi:MAG: DNA translocase FtsK, partial [Lentisphaeria bacterium]|nr:DNA translocase FtsK [Lentisphaeria bacterium]
PPPSVSSAGNVPPPIKQFAEEKKAFDREKPAGSDGGKVSFDSTLDYKLPPVALLDKQEESHTEDAAHIEQCRERLQKTLESFNVDGHVSEIIVGPRVTRFEITLAAGVKVEKVTGIQNNIAMDLAAESIRILAPIPGKTTVGIEVPNKVSSIVYIRSLFESAVWRESHAQIPIILGRDIAGKVIVTDLAKAPHLLIAGSTGSGKSVCMNTLIMSLLFKYSPAELRLIMVDPKVVELEMYRLIPHLITPVVNDPKKVPLALRWGVNEMERRYRVLAKVKAKNLEGFNNRPQDQVPVYDEDGERIPQKLPLVIIIIDELADIMMTEAKSDVETSICRIAQKGRAAGIHLVIATQTPRKDIITGLIKANLPTKIAFRVGSNMDSRVILDAGGAEKLLGKGDMLFNPPGGAGLVRIQGSMVSDPEIQKVADFVSVQVEQSFDAQVMAEDVQVHNGGGNDDGPVETSRSSREDQFGPDVDDIIGDLPGDEFINSCAAKYLQPGDSDLLRKALEIIIMEQKASTSYLQRRLGIGYNKSAELMDQLEQRGIISPPLPGGQKRNILITDGLEENHFDS